MNGKLDCSNDNGMRRQSKQNVRVVAAVLLVALGAVSPSCAAAERSSDRVSPFQGHTPVGAGNDLLGDQLLVRELMRLDAEQAAQRLRKGVSSSGAAVLPVAAESATVAAAQQRPVLQAIYGVGQRLVAEVLWQGQSYIYLKGQSLPAGRKADAVTLRLKSISARCIALQGPERLFELCLGSAGQEG